jgi:hypothetical protein
MRDLVADSRGFLYLFRLAISSELTIYSSREGAGVNARGESDPNYSVHIAAAYDNEPRGRNFPWFLDMNLNGHTVD